MTYVRFILCVCIHAYVCAWMLVKMYGCMQQMERALYITAREASWRRGFDPCTPSLFDLYHFLEQNGYFGLVPENPILSEPGSILLDGFDTRLIQRSFSCGVGML